jgi:hypothetical protein
MKSQLLKLAVIAVLGTSSQAFATGLVSLPAAGLSVSAGTNQPAGTTAWVTCNATGNYGAGSFTAPTTSANNNCAVFPANINTSPVTGFSKVTLSDLTNVAITANGENIAYMTSRTFRNAANTECIYGKQISMDTSTTFDYNSSLAGQQYLEVNDFAFGGFSATTDVSAGYYYRAGVSDSAVYRVGRAFTSVQMQADPFDETLVATGFVHRPINGPSVPASGTEINGVGQTSSPGATAPTAAQQTSEIRTNWVDFTVDVTGGEDEDGGTEKDSPMMYVRADCTSTAPASLANSVRIRQTGQETQPWVTILASGLARSGANANF